MSIWPFLRGILLLPVRLLRAAFLTVRFVARKTLGSVRFWVLLILTVIGLLVAYYAVANRYAPSTTDAYVQAYVIQVAPRVDGQVVCVQVAENQLVEKGTLLFEIDPRPYEHKVQQLEASLAQAIQQVAQMESELQAARADADRIAADVAFALKVHQQEKDIFDKDATTERKFLDAKQKHEAADASLRRAQAVISQKEKALRAKVGDEHALVAEVRAQLASARLNLEWTRVYAPSTGYITNLQLRVGSYVQIGHPVLTCIDTEQWWVVANFRESNLEYLQPGQPAGLVFKAYPGRIFPGTVRTVGWGVDEGQGVPSGNLPLVRNPPNLIPLAQRFQVRLTLNHPDDVLLRVGATGSVTVYTTPDFALNPVAELWQKVEAWFYYLR
jgi:multidrug resistance efflux pump